MFIFLLLLFTNCFSNISVGKFKGKVDDLISETRNLWGDKVWELDQSKLKRVIEEFVNNLNELEDPFASAAYGGFSFVHLLFALKCDEEGGLFDKAYEILTQRKVTEEEMFDLKTILDYNIIHLVINHGNQRGFEKIKEIAERRDLSQYFISTNSFGRDPFMLACLSLVAQFMGFCGNPEGFKNGGTVLFLKEAIQYMAPKRYFLNEQGSLNVDMMGQTLLNGAINIVVYEGYDNIEDEAESERYMHDFIPIFKFLLSNVAISLDSKEKALELLGNWKEDVKVEIPALLEKELDSFILEFIHMDEAELKKIANELGVIEKTIEEYINEKGIQPHPSSELKVEGDSPMGMGEASEGAPSSYSLAMTSESDAEEDKVQKKYDAKTPPSKKAKIAKRSKKSGRSRRKVSVAKSRKGSN